MPIPTYRSSRAAVGTGPVTPAAPTGLANNDVELLVVESADELVTLSTANGFVQVAGSPVSAGGGSPSTKTRITVFWRRWDGSAGDPTIADAGDHVIAQRHAFDGVVTSGNPWDITVSSAETVEDTSGSATGGTTTVDDCLVAICAAAAKYDPLSVTQYLSWANADLGSVTPRQEYVSSAGNDGLIALATGTKASAGAFGATTYTLKQASKKAHLVVALKGAPQIAQLINWIQDD